jgi:hypothetical protein
MHAVVTTGTLVNVKAEQGCGAGFFAVSPVLDSSEVKRRTGWFAHPVRRNQFMRLV